MRVLLATVCVCLVVAACAKPVSHAHDEVIRSLLKDVNDAQWKDTKSYEFPLGWGHKKGLYPNAVHMNLIGIDPMNLIREALKFPDDNMFVTTFVTSALMESMLLAPDVVPADDEATKLALEAMMNNRDKNIEDTTAPVFGFWPQRLEEKAAGPLWEQWADNLSGIAVSDEAIAKFLRSVLDSLGLGFMFDGLIKLFTTVCHALTHLFTLPSDADDTSAMVVASRYYTLLGSALPATNYLFRSAKYDFNKAFEHLTRYAYCPGSSDKSTSMIDSRTYYWARSYLRNLTTEDDCIVSTWMESLQNMTNFYRNVSAAPLIPFNVNNLDPSVGANSIYAMSIGLLGGSTRWFTESRRARQMYVRTAEFVAWAVANQKTEKRPDLELLYYPPTLNVMWFVARHVRMLQSHNGTLPFEEMEQVKSILTSAIRGPGTAYVLAQASSLCSGAIACWDDFLGQGDIPKHYDDRFFTTSIALNALIDGWTTESNGLRNLTWVPGTPSAVKAIVPRGVQYLKDAVADIFTPYDNCFFSGSVKQGPAEVPFFFPANVKENLKTGQEITCKNISFGDWTSWTLFGVRGHIPESTYQQMVKDGCGPMKVVDWHTYNLPIMGTFPFWSSSALSKALALNVLVKDRQL